MWAPTAPPRGRGPTWPSSVRLRRRARGGQLAAMLNGTMQPTATASTSTPCPHRQSGSVSRRRCSARTRAGAPAPAAVGSAPLGGRDDVPVEAPPDHAGDSLEEMPRCRTFQIEPVRHDPRRLGDGGAGVGRSPSSRVAPAGSGRGIVRRPARGGRAGRRRRHQGARARRRRGWRARRAVSRRFRARGAHRRVPTESFEASPPTCSPPRARLLPLFNNAGVTSGGGGKPWEQEANDGAGASASTSSAPPTG